MRELDRRLSAVSEPALVAGCFLLLGVIGFFDVATGPELAVSIFYLVPVGLVSWYARIGWGIAISASAAAVWLYLDTTTGRPYTLAIAPYWNGGVRLAFFYVVAYLIMVIRRRLHAEVAAANTDPLTGALNSRGFYDRLGEEILRSTRYKHPFSLAYLDLDNFKHVNDEYGHATGDDLLRAVADIARETTRKTDHVARLGGDEFALLLLETQHADAAAVIAKLRGSIAERMQQQGWPVAVSVGLVTFEDTPPETKETIRLADDLMYRVKKNGKDSVLHQCWRDGSLADA
ncbi:MAG: diguanylate cyclase [Candidatus Hydrogenedens sp.]|nr:diguanylate cyclase [Candidatus Hydrogenedens sp.]